MDDQLDAIQMENNDQDESVKAAQVSADYVKIDSGFTLGASANQDLSIDSSLACGVAAGRDMSVSESMFFSGAVGRDLNLNNSVAIALAARGGAQLENSVAVLAIGQEVSVQNGFLGLVIARQTNLAEGGKILLDAKQAAILGAAFGAVFALLGWLLRRK